MRFSQINLSLFWRQPIITGLLLFIIPDFSMAIFSRLFPRISIWSKPILVINATSGSITLVLSNLTLYSSFNNRDIYLILCKIMISHGHSHLEKGWGYVFDYIFILLYKIYNKVFFNFITINFNSFTKRF